MTAKQKTKTITSNPRSNVVLIIAGAALLLGMIVLLALFIQNKSQPEDDAAFLARYSNANHGSTIEEFALQTRDKEYEFTAIFNTKGEKLVECTINDPGMSMLHPQANQYIYSCNRQDLIIAHNHPGEDHTFSDADMLLTHSDGPFAAQIVFGHSHAYILRPGDQGWPAYNDAWQYLDNIYRQFLQGNYSVTSQIKPDADGNPLYTTEAFTHNYAENFNLRYDVTDLDNFKLTNWVP